MKKTVYVEFADWEGLDGEVFNQKMVEYCAAFGLEAKLDSYGQSGPVMEVKGDVSNVKVLLFEYYIQSYTENDRLNPACVKAVMAMVEEHVENERV